MDKINIGIIGCGAIAQVHHMPNLFELQDRFAVTWTCDVSPGSAAYVADRFGVPNHATDYRRLLDASDVDAVLLCHRDPKREIAVASLEAGKHMFIEKPMCFSMPEAHAIQNAAEASSVVAQVGYMKAYDPAFEVARSEARGWVPGFVQVNHLHPNNDLHTRQFDIRRFDDVPPGAGKASGAARQAALTEALGPDIPPEAERAFFILSGSMIHDLYGLRILLGNPTHVVSTEVWQEGRAVSTVLEYASGTRCIATWVDLPDLWDFRETLEIYGDKKRILLTYPTGFSRGQLSTVAIQEIDGAGTTLKREPAIEWESPFVRELKHFHACVTEGATCRTPVADALDDIQLIINITQSYLTGSPVAFVSR